jgi:hypothetical protein
VVHSLVEGELYRTDAASPAFLRAQTDVVKVGNWIQLRPGAHSLLMRRDPGVPNWLGTIGHERG